MPVYLVSLILMHNYQLNHVKLDAENDVKSYGKAIRFLLLKNIKENPNLNLQDWVRRTNRVSQKFSMRIVSLGLQDQQFPQPKHAQINQELLASGSVVTIYSEIDTKIFSYLSFAPYKPELALQLEEKFLWKDSASWQQFALTYGMVSLPFVVCMLGIGVISRYLLSKPLAALLNQSNELAAGNLNYVPDKVDAPEIQQVMDHLQKMSTKINQSHVLIEQSLNDKKILEEALKNENKLTFLGKMASGVAHELGTPLNVVLGHSKIIQAKAEINSKIQHSAKVIESQILRMTDLVRSMLDYARPKKPQKNWTCIKSVVQNALQLLEFQCKHLHIKSDGPQTLECFVDSNQLLQVLINIIQNAAQAMKSGGMLTVNWNLNDELKQTSIIITDNGPGILPEKLPNIFDPFFTTKEPGAGTGLGLSIAYGIVKEHNGILKASNRSNNIRGAEFVVILPGGQYK